MNLEKIKELAYKHMADRKAHKEREKGFIFYHGVRTGKLAVSLREAIIPGNTQKDQILRVAGYFHDVAKGIEPHGEYGAVLVKEILKDQCTPSELEEISELIFYHQKRKKDPNYSDYIKIFQDADTLDHLGTIEIWMNFNYYSYMEQPIEESVKFYNEHFDEQVRTMRELLNYQISERILDDKVQFVKDFAERMKAEANGEIFNFDILI